MTRLALVLGMLLFATACGSSRQTVPPGQAAPAFEAQDQTGATRSLSDYAGKVVVLYFYPRDATPGCTTEACAFRDAWDRFEAAGAVVLGVSTDDVESHAEFADEHGLTFPLLADVDGQIAERYGVPVRMGFTSRMTFLIDAQGTLRKVYEDVDPGVHADQVLGDIAAL